MSNSQRSDDILSRARVVPRDQQRRLVILVANSKGGSGKTTVASNLASYYAAQGRAVSLLDLDPQQSSTQWLKQREQNDIHGMTWPADEPLSVGRLQSHIQQAKEVLVVDSPAGLNRQPLNHLMNVSHVVLVPVLPSPIDIRATTRFLQTVMLTPSYRRRPRRLAVIANRVRPRTRMYDSLRQFLISLKIPYLCTLRDTQAYVQAMNSGQGIIDHPRADELPDVRHWRVIGEWLEVQRHLMRSLPGFL